MNESVGIPNSYEQWRHCIEVKCGIRLTSDYVGKRLDELQNEQHPKTRHFARLYGTDHLEQTIKWFRRAQIELSG